MLHNPIHNISLTDFIALLALILSSISFGWNLLLELQNRPKASIYCMVANTIPQDGKDYFNIRITNTGKRPIKISGVAYVGYKWWWPPNKKKQFVLMPKNIPIYLKEGEDVNEMFPYTKKDFKALLEDNIQGICAYDSVGGKHFMPKFQFIDFRNHVKRFVLKK